jgi:hypothetical protein
MSRLMPRGSLRVSSATPASPKACLFAIGHASSNLLQQECMRLTHKQTFGLCCVWQRKGAAKNGRLHSVVLTFFDQFTLVTTALLLRVHLGSAIVSYDVYAALTASSMCASLLVTEVPDRLGTPSDDLTDHHLLRNFLEGLLRRKASFKEALEGLHCRASLAGCLIRLIIMPSQCDLFNRCRSVKAPHKPCEYTIFAASWGNFRQPLQCMMHDQRAFTLLRTFVTCTW